MSITYHQTSVKSELLGDVNIAFIARGPDSNLDFQITDAWVDVKESGAVVALNTALTRTTYSRAISVDLDKRLFPAMRLNEWDALTDQAQQDREAGEDLHDLIVDVSEAHPALQAAE